MILPEEADFKPGRYKIFIRYKDGLSRAFEINANSELDIEREMLPKDKAVYTRVTCLDKKTQRRRLLLA